MAAAEEKVPVSTEIQAEFDSASFLKNVTSKPGVYRMLDAKGQVIYVGKAKNLKNRLIVKGMSYHFQSKTTHLNCCLK